MRDRVLVLNAGSSTLKASVLADGVERAAASVTVPMRGQADAADALHRAIDSLAGTGGGPASKPSAIASCTVARDSRARP
jgi:hypothetical protein